jgi:hypothetical protein
LQSSRNPRKINGDNLNNIRHEASRYFINKKTGYLKVRINELAKKNKNKKTRDLYKGKNEFKKGYEPRNNIEQNERGDLLADSHSILIRRKNYFSELLNVRSVSNVRQIEINATELVIHDPSLFEVKIATVKLKNINLQVVKKLR